MVCKGGSKGKYADLWQFHYMGEMLKLLIGTKVG